MKNVNRQQLLACLPSLQPLDTTSLSPTPEGLPCCHDTCLNLSLREVSMAFLPQVSGAYPLSNLFFFFFQKLTHLSL